MTIIITTRIPIIPPHTWTDHPYWRSSDLEISRFSSHNQRHFRHLQTLLKPINKNSVVDRNLLQKAVEVVECEPGEICVINYSLDALSPYSSSYIFRWLLSGSSSRAKVITNYSFPSFQVTGFCRSCLLLDTQPVLQAATTFPMNANYNYIC